MRDLSKAIRLQEWSAQEYAAARQRRDGPHRGALRDYIDDNLRFGAEYSAKAREAMGITDDGEMAE